MPAPLERARLLLQTRRYEEAEAVLHQALAGTPGNSQAHALLALALYRQDQDEEALQQVQIAIGLAPDHAHHHYIRALILLDMEREAESMAAIREALRLDPTVTGYYGLLGQLYMQKRAWQQALEAAETGLQLDPEDVQCANLRAMALVKLGRLEEAGQTIGAALACDPENSLTHANQGWAMLHRSKPEHALVHFREALRLNPMLDWARQGIVEALKAHNVIYRLMLRYFLWVSRLTTSQQWGVIAMSSGALTALRTIVRQVPVLWIIALPLLLLYRLFAFLTWTARPLFALVLRLDPFGRLALPREEIVASNWVGACLLVSLVSLLLVLPLGAASLFADWPVVAPAFLLLSAAAFLLMMPVAGVFRRPPGGRRVILAVYTGLLGMVGLVAFLFALTGAAWGIGVGMALGMAFFLGWTLYSWLAFLLAMTD
ncbi:MAG TPA: tetratricopeptide repeat protein [Chloroflexi bacterium]|nr:tetratricopeptide repeat protein [Chloroflexota bacterium]